MILQRKVEIMKYLLASVETNKTLDSFPAFDRIDLITQLSGSPTSSKYEIRPSNAPTFRGSNKIRRDRIRSRSVNSHPSSIGSVSFDPKMELSENDLDRRGFFDASKKRCFAAFLADAKVWPTRFSRHLTPFSNTVAHPSGWFSNWKWQ